MNILKNWQRNNWFGEIVRAGEDKLFDSSDIPRLYVLVRDDILPPIHQGIQAAHAIVTLSNLLHEKGKVIDMSSYIILLGASRQEIIHMMKQRKKISAGYTDTQLIDPSTGFVILTALAFEPMSLVGGNKLFGHLKRSS